MSSPLEISLVDADVKSNYVRPIKTIISDKDIIPDHSNYSNMIPRHEYDISIYINEYKSGGQTSHLGSY